MDNQNTQTPKHNRKGKLWVGRIMSAIPALFLIMDSIMKLMNIQAVRDTMTQLGYPTTLSATLGIVTLICVAFYLVPRTSVLGAILLTGYLGGAVATHVRVGDPLFSHILFPVYIGILVWGGLYLRDYRVANLIPIKK
jgi:hypothetical protein